MIYSYKPFKSHKKVYRRRLCLLNINLNVFLYEQTTKVDFQGIEALQKSQKSVSTSSLATEY